MKRRLPWVLAAVFLLGGAVWLHGRWFSDEARIRRTVRGMLADLNFRAGTGLLAKTAKFNGLMSRFTDDVTVGVEQIIPVAPSLSGRVELHAMVLAAFRQLSSCAVTLHDVAVTPIPEGAATAKAAFTVSVFTTTPVLELPGQEFEVELRKNSESRWLISRVSAVRTLRR